MGNTGRNGIFLALGMLVFTLTECKSAPADDDDAGASGEGAKSGTGSVGAGASGAAAGQQPAAGTSAALGGSAGAGAKGGAAGSAGTPVGGSSGRGGSSAGMTAASGSAGTNGSCGTTPLVVRYPDPPPVDKATFDAMFPTLMCAAMKPCCATKGTAYDEAACKTFAGAYYDKTLTYDPIEGARCFQSLGLVAPVCDDNLGARGIPGACTIVYRGALALGAECDRIGVCAPDPRGPVNCDYSDQVSKSICTVEIRGKLGDACDEGCELTSDLGVCYAKDEPMKLGEWVTCSAEDGLRRGAKDTCEATRGAGCDCFSSSDYCDGANYCEDNMPCQARGGPGTPCTLNMFCKTDTYCPRTGDQKCTPRKHGGDPCDTNDECVGLFCLLDNCNLDNRDTQNAFDDAFCDGKGT